MTSSAPETAEIGQQPALPANTAKADLPSHPGSITPSSVPEAADANKSKSDVLAADPEEKPATEADNPDEKTEAPGGDADAEEEEEPELEVSVNGSSPPKAESGSVQLGYRTFNSRKDAADYFHKILSKMAKDTDLNEYEFKAVYDLLLKGHHNADAKIGCGVKAIQVRNFNTGDKSSSTKCFYVVRKDGTTEDFSLFKCLQALFSGGGSGGAKSLKRHGNQGGGPNKWQKRSDGGRHGGGGGRRFHGRGRRGGRGGGRR